MNNPVQFMQMMRNPQMQQQIINSPQFQQKLRSMNPSVILDQIANNPQAMNIPMVKSVIENRNDTESLTGLAENVFKEKGQDYSKFETEAKQFLGFN